MAVDIRWFPRPSLGAITAIAAATLGVIMSVGGLALLLATLSTPQSRLQVVTAVALLTTGVVNVRTSRGIWRQESRALLVSGLTTVVFIVFLAAGLRDFGEPFWMHGVYVLLLLALAYRARMRWRAAV